MEVVPSPTAIDFAPGDLFALGAIMAGQRMAEHVRKLQDTGLATYQGNDPATLILIIAIAAVLGTFAGLILHYCDDPPQPTSGTTVGVPSTAECAVAYFVLGLCVAILGAGALLAITVIGGTVGASVGLAALFEFAILVVEAYENRPRFQPQPASG